MKKDSELSRRKFLHQSAAAAIALAPLPALAQNTDQVLGAEDSKAPTSSTKGAPEIRVLLHEADGTPMARDRASTLHARDMANDPLPQPIHSAEGRARIELPKEPVQLSCRLKVPGFGEVYCYADRQGKGYTKPENVEFVVEAAATRLHRVREMAERAKQTGVPADSAIHERLTKAARPIPAKPEGARIAAAYESLAHGLHAGEMLALNMARHRISKFPNPRKDFLFGSAISHYWEGGAFVKHFLEAFNLGTGSWYTWAAQPEPAENRISYARMDQSIQWCLDNKLVPRGFGYVYLTQGATPEWIRS